MANRSLGYPWEAFASDVEAIGVWRSLVARASFGTKRSQVQILSPRHRVFLMILCKPNFLMLTHRYFTNQ